VAILRRVGGGRAFCSVGALLALVVVAGFGLHGAWAADPPKLVWHECAARVVQVQSPTRVVLNRGRVDGLKVADRLPVYAMGADGAVDFTLRLARGRVMELADTTAVLDMELVVAPVRVGDQGRYTLQVSEELSQNVLFELAAHDIDLTAGFEDVPAYRLGDVLANPTPQWRDAMLERFRTTTLAGTAEPVVREKARTVRVFGARHDGQTLEDALLATTPDDVTAFLDFVRAYPGRYASHQWRFIETYATWLINRSPSGQRLLLDRQILPLLERARDAMTAGRLDEAERGIREALKVHPESAWAKEKLEVLRKVGIWHRTVTADPGDTATRWKLVRAYTDMRALDLAASQLDALEKARFRPNDCTAYRGRIAVWRKDYAKAIAIFRKLERGGDRSMNGWMRWAEEMQRLRADPQSFAAKLALGRVQEDAGQFDDATGHYRDALDRSRTPDEFEQARAGQERVALRRRVDDAVGTAKARIERHDLPGARTEVNRIVDLCKRIGSAACLAPPIQTLVGAADDVGEGDFVLELRQRQLEIEPGNAVANASMAAEWLSRQQLDRALPFAQRAAALDPKYAHPHSQMAEVALRRADTVAARAALNRALALGKSPWALRQLARLEAAEGHWDEAIRAAKASQDIDPDGGRYWPRVVQSACHRLKAASAAIAASDDVERNRLRLVRSYAALSLPWAALRETNAMDPQGPLFREARWAVADAGEPVPLTTAERLAAARDSGEEIPVRHRLLQMLEGRAAWEAKPGDGVARRTYAQALVHTARYERALAVIGLPGDPTGVSEERIAAQAKLGLEATRQLDLATESRDRGDTPTANRLMAQAAATFREIGAVTDQLLTEWPLALLRKGSERLAAAKDLLDRARADGDPVLASGIDRMVGDLLAEDGDLDAPRQALERTRKACADADDDGALGNAYRSLSSDAWSRGHLSEAWEHLRQAQRLADREGDAEDARELRLHEASLSLASDDAATAQRIAEALFAEARKQMDDSLEWDVLVLLANLDMGRGDVVSALARHDQAYAYGERLGNVNIRAVARFRQGNVYLYAAHDAKAALPAFRQAAELWSKEENLWGEADAQVGVGESLALLGDAAGARAAFDQAVPAYRKQHRTFDLAGVLTEVALLEAKAGRAGVALVAAREAVDLATPSEGRRLRAHAWYALAKAQDAVGNPTAALTAYEKAVTLLGEVLSRASGDSARANTLNYGRNRDIFRDAIDLCLRLGETARALELLEMSRDSQLRRVFQGANLKAQDEGLKRSLDDLKTAEARAAATQKALADEAAKPADVRSEAKVDALAKVAASTEGEMRQLLLRLKRDHREIYALLAINPESISELRDSLPEDTVVIEYFLADEALYAFIIARNQDKPTVVKVAVSAAEIEQAVFAYRQAIGRRPVQVLALARKLHGWLIAPVEAEMAKAKTTLIVPFGPLYYLPFHALASDDAEGNPVYVLEKHRVGYLSSLTIFKMLRRGRNEGPRTLLAFANPDKTLKGARAEAERIKSQAFPDATVYYEQDATKERFFQQAGQFSMIHFATHGVLDPDPAESRLAMANAALTVDEITGFEGLKGHTDLVVLSACETAVELKPQMGHEKGRLVMAPGTLIGDEVISIASAFAAAGAPALVASLWQVDDAATSELMAHFYGLLRSSPSTDVLEALRQAQLHVLRLEVDGRRRLADPSFWAAFELIGDFR
jgi:CHAT domain-containing protein